MRLRNSAEAQTTILRSRFTFFSDKITFVNQVELAFFNNKPNYTNEYAIR